MRLVVALLLLVLASPARADESTAGPALVILPIKCAQFWTVSRGAAAWDGMLSFAACIQDASVPRIEREEELAAALRTRWPRMREGDSPLRLAR